MPFQCIAGVGVTMEKLGSFPTTFPVVLNKIVGAKDQLLVFIVHQWDVKSLTSIFRKIQNFFNCFLFWNFELPQNMYSKNFRKDCKIFTMPPWLE
jgi:hypothetical protein